MKNKLIQMKFMSKLVTVHHCQNAILRWFAVIFLLLETSLVGSLLRTRTARGGSSLRLSRCWRAAAARAHRREEGYARLEGGRASASRAKSLLRTRTARAGSSLRLSRCWRAAAAPADRREEGSARLEGGTGLRLSGCRCAANTQITDVTLAAPTKNSPRAIPKW